jgi:trigger factor
LADQAALEYPSVMIEHEIDHILEDQANLDPRDPRAQLLYLQRLNKGEEEVRDSVREEATSRLRRSLVLSKFAETEDVSVADADIETELETISSSAGDQADAIRQLFNNDSARDSLARTLHTRRTLARLVELTSQADGKTATPKRTAKPRRAGPRNAQE